MQLACCKWGANLGIEDGLVSPKHFCDFLPIKSMWKQGWWRLLLILYPRKLISPVAPAKVSNSQKCERHPKTVGQLRHYPKKILQIWFVVFGMYPFFWCKVFSLFLLVVCFPLSQLLTNPGKNLGWSKWPLPIQVKGSRPDVRWAHKDIFRPGGALKKGHRVLRILWVADEVKIDGPAIAG